MIRKVLMSACIVLAFEMMSTAQSVGISSSVITPDASSMLDIQASNKGLLIPRVALTAINAPGPITTPATSLMVYNTDTAGVAPNNVTPGYYYWNGTMWMRFLGARDAWLTTGNIGMLPATNFMGTLDAQPIVFRTNNVERMRILATGQFSLNDPTPSAGDVLSAYGNSSTLNWALNGYHTSTFGGGLYAENTNTTNGYNAMEGVTRGVYSGVYGLHITNTGLGYGVYGSSNSTSGFGVYGSSPAVVPTNTGAAGYYDWDLVCGDLWTYSDRNLKKNITSYNGALNDILKLEVFSFVYDQKILSNSDNRQRYGFVAQQLESVFPTFVKTKTLFSSGARMSKSENTYGPIGEYKVVNYVEMIPVLTKAMQEQQQIIETLQKRIEELEKENKAGN